MAVDGKWDVVLDSPMGAQASVLTLTARDGQLTGSLSGPMGELEIEDGTADGDHLEWTAQVTSPVALTVEFWVDVEGDSLAGEVKLGPMGNATLTGTRAP